MKSVKNFPQLLKKFNSLLSGDGEDITHDLADFIYKNKEDGQVLEKLVSKIEESGDCFFDPEIVASLYATDVLGYFIGDDWEFVQTHLDKSCRDYLSLTMGNEWLDDIFNNYKGILGDNKLIVLAPDERERLVKLITETIDARINAYCDAHEKLEDFFEDIKNKIEIDTDLDVSVYHSSSSSYLHVWNAEKKLKIRVSDHERTSRLHKTPDINISIDCFHDHNIQLADFDKNGLPDKILTLISNEFEIEFENNSA